jgi:prepilin-type N-terminal cleavage/methylation domain-containing protein
MFVGRSRLTAGFTVLELLIVIAIIGYLSSFVFSNTQTARDKAFLARGQKELITLYEALQLYMTDRGGRMPADVSRGLPAGLEDYLPTGTWPNAPWPGSVYDWDVWDDPSSATDIVQISIRFCPAGGAISTCNFPKESWASNFGVNSSFYYCIQGSCRSHINEAVSYPGRCANCGNASST